MSARYLFINNLLLLSQIETHTFLRSYDIFSIKLQHVWSIFHNYY